jgi:hypothetical protein
MTEPRELTDEEVLDIAARMTDAERLKLIERLGSLGSAQAHRIAMFLMDLHLAERAKPTTLH